MESKAGNTRDVPNTIPGILIYTVRFGEVPGRQEPTHSVYRHQHRAEAPLRNERIATTFSPDTTVAAVGRDWFVMTGRGDLYKNDEKFLAKNLEIPRPAFTVDQTSGDWYAVQWKGTHNDALRGLDGHALDAAPEVIGQNFTAGTRIAAAFGNWFVTTAKGVVYQNDLHVAEGLPVYYPEAKSTRITASTSQPGKWYAISEAGTLFTNDSAEDIMREGYPEQCDIHAAGDSVYIVAPDGDIYDYHGDLVCRLASSVCEAPGVVVDCPITSVALTADPDYVASPAGGEAKAGDGGEGGAAADFDPDRDWTALMREASSAEEARDALLEIAEAIGAQRVTISKSALVGAAKEMKQRPDKGWEWEKDIALALRAALVAFDGKVELQAVRPIPAVFRSDACVLWLKADKPDSLIVTKPYAGMSDDIIQWADESLGGGKGTNAVRVDDSTPIPSKNGMINGVPAVSFAPGQMLKGAGPITFQTVVVVFKARDPANIPAFSMIFGANAGNESISTDFSLRLGEGGGFNGDEANDNDIYKGGKLSLGGDAPGVSCSTHWPDWPEAACIAVAQCPVKCVDHEFSLSSKFMGRGMDACVGEVACFNRALEDDELAAVRTYLGTKWGVNV